MCALVVQSTVSLVTAAFGAVFVDELQPAGEAVFARIIVSKYVTTVPALFCRSPEDRPYCARAYGNLFVFRFELLFKL